MVKHEPIDLNAPIWSIAVLGPGGVGGFVAAALGHAGEDVTVIARDSSAELIRRDGIYVRSAVLGDFSAQPLVATGLAKAVDVLFVATKADGLNGALERVRTTPALVVPLLNGLDHVALLRARFGAERVAAASIRIESERIAPGRIAQTSPQVRIELAADDPTPAAQLPAIAKLLERAGIPTVIGSSEKQVLWSKLVRLNALSATTSAFEEPIGTIRRDSAQRAALVGCIEEGAAVANADSAEIDPGATLAELDRAHASLRSSMQKDIAAGRVPELDSIQGAVLRAAVRLGVPCPTITQLTERIARRAGIPAPV